MDHTVLPANTPHLHSLRNRSPEGATAVCSNSSHLIAAYYSFINPERVKGRVGLLADLQLNAGKRPYLFYFQFIYFAKEQYEHCNSRKNNSEQEQKG